MKSFLYPSKNSIILILYYRVYVVDILLYFQSTKLFIKEQATTVKMKNELKKE